MSKLGPIAGLLATLMVFIGGCATPQGTGGDQGAGSYLPLVGFLVVIFAIFYFIMIRPQRRQQKEHQRQIQELKKGDQIITAGGIFGSIESISEDSVIIKVESGATIRVAKNSVAIRRSK